MTDTLLPKNDDLEVALNEIADTAAVYGEHSARTVGRIKSAMRLIHARDTKMLEQARKESSTKMAMVFLELLKQNDLLSGLGEGVLQELYERAGIPSLNKKEKS